MMETAVRLLLAGTVSDAGLRQSIEDDLLEEYEARRTGQGGLVARCWLAVQLVLSFPDFAGLGARERMPLLPQVAGRFYGVLALVVALGAGLSEVAIRLGPSEDIGRGLVVLCGAVVAAALAGYLLAVVAVRASLAGALGLGVVAAAVMIGAIGLGTTVPRTWYLASCALLFPPAALAGGLMRARQRLASPPGKENSSC